MHLLPLLLRIPARLIHLLGQQLQHGVAPRHLLSQRLLVRPQCQYLAALLAGEVVHRRHHQRKVGGVHPAEPLASHLGIVLLHEALLQLEAQRLQLDDGVVMGGHRLPQLRRTHGELCDLGPVVVTGRGGCLAPAGASHRLVRIADEAAAVVVATIVVGPGSLWKLLAQYLDVSLDRVELVHARDSRGHTRVEDLLEVGHLAVEAHGVRHPAVHLLLVAGRCQPRVTAAQHAAGQRFQSRPQAGRRRRLAGQHRLFVLHARLLQRRQPREVARYVGDGVRLVICALPRTARQLVTNGAEHRLLAGRQRVPGLQCCRGVKPPPLAPLQSAAAAARVHAPRERNSRPPRARRRGAFGANGGPPAGCLGHRWRQAEPRQRPRGRALLALGSRKQRVAAAFLAAPSAGRLAVVGSL
mmetsp:Transcript_5604/g.14346  ORF Transcript_5604/g.14346 Transcript_5604/m.14346 type:complete len:412 (-) Transcript_5604:263-1498(-)